MKRAVYFTGVVGLLLTLALFGYIRLTATSVSAAPAQQGIGQLPLDLYILLNQPGPLWLAGIDLEGVDLAGTKLTGANLRGSRLIRVNLSGTNLVGANLSEANLTSANLSSALLQGANLAGSVLANADLRGANLSTADLSDANLRNARYDESTIWPEGFDLDNSGVRLFVDNPTPSPSSP